jgi:hypothetical protein
MGPITGLAQTIDFATFKNLRHPEIFKIDGLALARSIHFLGKELGVSILPTSLRVVRSDQNKAYRPDIRLLDGSCIKVLDRTYAHATG